MSGTWPRVFESQPGPLLTRSWDGGVTGWIVVFGASVTVLVAGFVTNQMPTVLRIRAIPSATGQGNTR